MVQQKPESAYLTAFSGFVFFALYEKVMRGKGVFQGTLDLNRGGSQLSFNDCPARGVQI
jgi:hypothetical protein